MLFAWKGNSAMSSFLKTLASSVLFLGLLGVCLPALAQQIPLYPGVAPGSEGWTRQEATAMTEKGPMVRNITKPTITAYLPDKGKANGTAIVIAPGGGYHYLAIEAEGSKVAEWLRERGVTAFVLKYRVAKMPESDEAFRQYRERANSGARTNAPTTDPAEMKQIREMAANDGRQALKIVRQRASEWGIDPNRIGIMGFSAGAMMTMEVVMQHDPESRPNFAAPIYGRGVDAPVPEDAPPLFIVCAANDPLVPPVNSAKLFIQWKEAGKSAELHIYAKGGHGFGMLKQGLPTDHWIDRFGDWLELEGLLKPAGTAMSERSAK
jgi:acetyl esterase/lipase